MVKMSTPSQSTPPRRLNSEHAMMAVVRITNMSIRYTRLTLSTMTGGSVTASHQVYHPVTPKQSDLSPQTSLAGIVTRRKQSPVSWSAATIHSSSTHPRHPKGLPAYATKLWPVPRPTQGASVPTPRPPSMIRARRSSGSIDPTPRCKTASSVGMTDVTIFRNHPMLPSS
uniref:Uncharacterized protein n=1 Tax=Cacopsylla melanoneura TaxID=428564 RepID=A0A8D9FII7_9HEMI